MMKKGLTNSSLERQNILNNRYAIEQAENHLDLGGIKFQGETLFTKHQVIDLFGISDTTIERYISLHGDELKKNGYTILRGESLRKFKRLTGGTSINEGTKISILGVFNFRAILNLAMLLTESEQAKLIRGRLLDIVIDTLAKKSGGHTKYINQRDNQYLLASFQEESYRKEFTNALDDYVDAASWKYGLFTNLVYKSIFQENAEEYRKILKLKNNDGTRETMYSEVLTLIASYETGFADALRSKYKEVGKKLSIGEARSLFKSFESQTLLKPLIVNARTNMASRDLCFRDALHEKLEAYIQSIPEADFDRFLGETSKSLEERMSDPETLAIFKRLKDR